MKKRRKNGIIRSRKGGTPPDKSIILEILIMKLTKVFASFDPAVFISTFICFIIFINILFFLEGTFFTEGGYVFDAHKYVFEQVQIALLCSLCAAFAKKRER